MKFLSFVTLDKEKISNGDKIMPSPRVNNESIHPMQQVLNIAKDTFLPVVYTAITEAVMRALNSIPKTMCEATVEAWNSGNVTVLEQHTYEKVGVVSSAQTLYSIKANIETFPRNTLYLGIAAWGCLAHVIHRILVAKKPEFNDNFSRSLSMALSATVMLSAAAYMGENISEIAEVAMYTLGISFICTKAIIPLIDLFKWNTPMVSFCSHQKREVVKNNKPTYEWTKSVNPFKWQNERERYKSM